MGAHKSELAVGDELARSGLDELPTLLGSTGEVLTVRFRSQAVTVIARGEPSAGGEPARQPLTDVVALELATEGPDAAAWPRPVAIDAVVVTGRDPVRTVKRASRWASYATRVAIVPPERISNQALVEANFQGVWLLAAGEQLEVRVAGERGATPGSCRGLFHRLLDEVVFAALQRRSSALPVPQGRRQGE
ncbi:hypothetical protein ACWEVP_07970 [Amycolatopsis sp. NPDC003865]